MPPTERFTDDNERRRFSRVAFKAQGTLAQSGRAYAAQLLDVSVKGALVQVDDREAITEEPASLTVALENGAPIEMQMQLIHRRRDYLGFQCLSIDMDSAAHLRRLIELNLGNPDASERVLEELVAFVGSPIKEP